MSLNITITLHAAGSSSYTDNVQNLLIGNMVAPCGNTFYYEVNSNPWTWSLNSENDNKFGLMGNYQYNGADNPGEKTAYSMVCIDPTKFPPGNYDIAVQLWTAEIDGDENNMILQFQSFSGNNLPENGVWICTWPSQSPSTFQPTPPPTLHL